MGYVVYWAQIMKLLITISFTVGFAIGFCSYFVVAFLSKGG